MTGPWERLLAGSVRGAEIHPIAEPDVHRPEAALLSCSDARVRPSLVFDQDPGRLFTVQVAGAVPSVHGVESIEYAVVALGAPLVVVLGHDRCAAVGAAVGRRDGTSSTDLLPCTVGQIVEMIGDHHGVDAVRAAVSGTVEALRPVVPEGVQLVGAVVHEHDGQVEAVVGPD